MKTKKYRIGAQLKKYREAKDLKQSDVAKFVGVAPSTYANWEQGTNRPSADQLAILCRVFDVSADVLLEMDAGKPTTADMEMVEAYHAAPTHIQEAVSTLLAPYKKGIARAM